MGRVLKLAKWDEKGGNERKKGGKWEKKGGNERKKGGNEKNKVNQINKITLEQVEFHLDQIDQATCYLKPFLSLPRKL